MDLSIIIPVYNAEKYIKECLESIIGEIDSNAEVIIIDDGSKDRSYDICKSYIRNNIKVFKNENRGVSFSRNYGIKKSIGKYLMFVDADDLLKKGWYNLVSNEIDEENDLIYFSSKIKDENLNKEQLIEKIIGISSEANYASACSKLYKKEFITKNNIHFDKDLINGEDLMFNLNVAVKTNNYKVIKNSIYYYRINYNSATHEFNKNFFSSNIKFLEKTNNLLKITECSDAFREKVVSYSFINGIYLIICKFSLLKYKESRKIIGDFKKKYFEHFMKISKNYNYKNIGLFERIVLKLIKKEMFLLSISIIKLKNLILKFYKKSMKIEMDEL